MPRRVGLSWRKRVDTGHTIQIPALDFGVAHLLLLPGESLSNFSSPPSKRARILCLCRGLRRSGLCSAD
jgi:hypothetical protein